MNTTHFESSTQFPTKIFLTGLAFEVVLVALYWLDIATNYNFQLLHGLFDLDSEGNIPAWFSSCQLFAVAISFFSCARRQGTDSRPSRVFFILAGVGALYVSSDETAQIHEKVHALIGARYIDWVPAFAAQNFFLVMVFVAVLVSIGQMLSSDALALWTHHRRIVLLTALGAGIGLTGGMVVEALGYQIPTATHPILYRVEVTVEEFMEMSGASVILLAALHMRRRLKTKTRLLTMRRRIPNESLSQYQAVS